MLNVLLKITCDIFDQLTEVEKGKYMYKTAIFMQSLNASAIQKDENTWVVPSEKDRGLTYIVHLTNANCIATAARCVKICIHVHAWIYT